MDRQPELDSPVGERPTAEDLVDLLDDLRREGFSLGVEEYLTAERIRSTWASLAPSSPEILRTWIGPVLCTSRGEQEVFYERFGDRLGTWAQTVDPSTPGAPEEPAQRLDRETRRLRTWPWIVGGIVLLLALVRLIAWLDPPLLRVPTATPVPIQREKATAVAPPRSSPVDARSTAAPLQEAVEPSPKLESAERLRFDGRIAGSSGDGVSGALVDVDGAYRTVSDAAGRFSLAVPDQLAADPQRRSSGERQLLVTHRDYSTCEAGFPGDASARLDVGLEPSWRRFADELRLALVLFPLLGFVGWLGWSRSRRRLVIERRVTRDPLDLATIPVPSPRQLLFSGAKAKRAQVELAIHRSIESRDLDAAATVAATTAALGLFRPVYGVRRVRPAYLVLVDRRGLSDQQARFVDELVSAAASGEIVLQHYSFRGDPRLCASPDGRERVDLRELHARYPGYRVLIFSDGAGLEDPVTGRAVAWLGLLASWSERALFTPIETPHWGERELSLAAAGFHVLPLSMEGLRTFAETLRDPTEQQLSGSPWSQPFPTDLDEQPTRWLERKPAAEEDVKEILGDLRLYLGDAGYRWLCACAVYPGLSWHLTLYLGVRLSRASATPVLSEASLLRLVRLPWFRHGTMPDWIRVPLVTSLSPTDENSVRAALRDILLRDLLDPGSAFVLEFGRPQRRSRRRLRQFLVEVGRQSANRGPLHDYVLVTFLLGRLGDLQVVAPGALQRLVFERGLRFLGVRTAAAFSIALLGAALGWVVGTVVPWPDTVVPCQLSIATAPGKPVEEPRSSPSPRMSPEAQPTAILPPPAPELTVGPATPPPSPAPTASPEATPLPTGTPRPTVAATASPRPTDVEAYLDRIREIALLGRTKFYPSRDEPLSYGDTRDFSVDLDSGLSADRIDIRWSVDGREVSRGARFNLTADQPELVRKQPLVVRARVQFDTETPIEKTWRLPILPPVPRIAGSEPPTGTDVALPTGETTTFRVDAQPPIGAQKLSYVFEVDGKEQRSESPTFTYRSDGSAAASIVAYVVDDFGQRSANRLSWKLQGANLESLVKAWMGRFEAAWNDKDAAGIGRMLGLDASSVASLAKTFEDKRDLSVKFSDIKVESSGRNQATVTYQRTERFTDARSGRAQTLGPVEARHAFRLDGTRLVAMGGGDE